MVDVIQRFLFVVDPVKYRVQEYDVEGVSSVSANIAAVSKLETLR